MVFSVSFESAEENHESVGNCQKRMPFIYIPYMCGISLFGGAGGANGSNGARQPGGNGGTGILIISYNSKPLGTEVVLR